MRSEGKGVLLENGLLPQGVAVAEVIDRWFGPDYRYVKVLDEGGGVYILRKGTVEARWRVVFYEALDFREGGLHRWFRT